MAVLPLTESTFTEIIREANVINAANKNVSPAVTNEIFRAPDLVRTGDGSRIEMTAPDKTLTRAWGPTPCSPSRRTAATFCWSMAVFCSMPPRASAAAPSTTAALPPRCWATAVCVVMHDGRFKVMDLEGGVIVTLRDNRSVTLDFRADGGCDVGWDDVWPNTKFPHWGSDGAPSAHRWF